jgi:hypothetical protein
MVVIATLAVRMEAFKMDHDVKVEGVAGPGLAGHHTIFVMRLPVGRFASNSSRSSQAGRGSQPRNHAKEREIC